VGPEPIGIIGELLTCILNSNIHIYRVSPVFTIIELHMITEIGKLFGFENSDGLTCPGGTFSNLMAMLTARNSLYPHTKFSGVNSSIDQLVALTSSEAHYSISKAANVLGIGLNNVIKIPTDHHGQMILSDLERIVEELISQGKKPFFLNATAGTTVMGGFDPFEGIAKITQKHNIWYHIDACWGGSLIFSKKHSHLLTGSHLADSIAWNPHKLLGLPLQMSILLVKKKGLLQQSNALGAAYLFKGNDFDLGDKTIQCSRRPDILKLFLTWKYLGTEGFEKRVDLALENTKKFVEMIKKRSDSFTLVIEPRALNTCFWYDPDWVRRLEDGQMKNDILTEVTTGICEKVNERGMVLVDYSPNPRGGEFFRMVINSPNVRDHDLEMVFEEIIEIGKTILPQIYKKNFDS